MNIIAAFAAVLALQQAPTWDALGASATTGLLTEGSCESTPAVAIDIEGNPVVAWVQPVNTERVVYVRKWDGHGWIPLGNSATGSGISGLGGNSLLVDQVCLA